MTTTTTTIVGANLPRRNAHLQDPSKQIHHPMGDALVVAVVLSLILVLATTTTGAIARPGPHRRRALKGTRRNVDPLLAHDAHVDGPPELYPARRLG